MAPSGDPRPRQRQRVSAASVQLLTLAFFLASAALLARTALGADSVYWDTQNVIRVANLDGSGSPSDLFTGETNPLAVAIDPATGKIYWTTDKGGGAIRVGNLDGSGSAHDLFSGQDFPEGVAIDPGAGKIYWSINTNTS